MLEIEKERRRKLAIERNQEALNQKKIEQKNQRKVLANACSDSNTKLKNSLKTILEDLERIESQLSTNWRRPERKRFSNCCKSIPERLRGKHYSALKALNVKAKKAGNHSIQLDFLDIDFDIPEFSVKKYMISEGTVTPVLHTVKQKKRQQLNYATRLIIAYIGCVVYKSGTYAALLKINLPNAYIDLLNADYKSIKSNEFELAPEEFVGRIIYESIDSNTNLNPVIRALFTRPTQFYEADGWDLATHRNIYQSGRVTYDVHGVSKDGYEFEEVDIPTSEIGKIINENITSISQSISEEQESLKIESEISEAIERNIKQIKLLESLIDEFFELPRSFDKAQPWQSLQALLASSDLDFTVVPYTSENIIKLKLNVCEPEDLPDREEFRITNKGTLSAGRKISQRRRRELYNSHIYALNLCLLDCTFHSNPDIEGIGINTHSASIDKGTGRPTENCFSSIFVSHDEFKAIDLQRVEPKACFKRLKGVAASDLATLTPVPPIFSLSTADSRFSGDEAVLEKVEIGTNLASMHWLDFEHLVRELFEAEFDSETSEVRITQASSDGGVDAVVFDKDPIRGGKIIIQAKRYTGLVPVSAVRDLYGTVVNEGAIKGILVTTSNYGADSYKFASEKPLTLLDGSNLLHLLQSHGTKAHINLANAKRLLKSGVEVGRISDQIK